MKLKGRYVQYGGFYVPEVLIPAIEEIEAAYLRFQKDPAFVGELNSLLADYAGRPTPLYHARRFSEQTGFAVWLKREDLLHGGAHKTNNALGQGLLAKYMGKKKLIAETGAGQHGLATAMVGALFGMETKIFMGSIDVARQNVSVRKMKLLAEVIGFQQHGYTQRRDHEALRYWTANGRYVLSVWYGRRTPSVSDDAAVSIRHQQGARGVWNESGVCRMWSRPVWRRPNAIGIFPAF